MTIPWEFCSEEGMPTQIYPPGLQHHSKVPGLALAWQDMLHFHHFPAFPKPLEAGLCLFLIIPRLLETSHTDPLSCDMDTSQKNLMVTKFLQHHNIPWEAPGLDPSLNPLPAAPAPHLQARITWEFSSQYFSAALLGILLPSHHSSLFLHSIPGVLAQQSRRNLSSS